MSIYKSEDEVELKARLDNLFQVWRAKIGACTELSQKIKNTFVTDGFYPGYLNQKVKVLFVGRESLSIDGDFIECLYWAYRSGYVGGKHINRYQMQSLQFYMVYGFNNAFPDYCDVPSAYDLARVIGDDNALSFAFINVSKFSNWSEDWKLDYGLVMKSLSQSQGTPYLSQQIELLNPDVICSMNVLGMAGNQIGKYNYVRELSCHDVSVHDYFLPQGRVIPLLDMWHFSATRKSPRTHYYTPVAEHYKQWRERYPSINIGS